MKLFFASVGKKGAFLAAKDVCAEDRMKWAPHFTVVACVIVKFGAAQRGGAIVKGSASCQGG